jgi:hypothetical protein
MGLSVHTALVTSNPCDPGVLFEYLQSNGLLPSDTLNVAFVGCGCGSNEYSLIQKIAESGHAVPNVFLMDRHITTSTLSTVCSIKERFEHKMLVRLIPDFLQLGNAIQATEGVFLVLGINAGLMFTDVGQRQFADFCRMCAAEPRVPCDWLNFRILDDGGYFADAERYDLVHSGSPAGYTTYAHRRTWESLEADSERAIRAREAS